MPFDLNRAILYDELDPPPWDNAQTIPLSEVSLPDSHPVFITQFAGETLVFDLLSLIYSHTAQGILKDEPWLVSFCMICNAGACFSPLLDDKVHHFRERGLYDAMTLIGDVETDSVWHHITGECLYGTFAGKTLAQHSLVQQATIQEVREAYPKALYVTPHTTAEEIATAQRWNKFRENPNPEMPQEWTDTLALTDERLPRLEAGLGVWHLGQARFYSYRTLNLNDNLVLDTFAGRKLLVYVEEESATPHAVFVEAQSAEWRGDKIHLDNGATLRYGILHQGSEQRRLERPRQLFQRWYSFATLFPKCEIYEAI